MTTTNPTTAQPAPLDLEAAERNADHYRRLSHQIGTWESADLCKAAARSADDADRLVAEVRRLRDYAETTRYHQQKHADAFREVERLRAELERVEAERAVDAIETRAELDHWRLRALTAERLLGELGWERNLDPERALWVPAGEPDLFDDELERRITEQRAALQPHAEILAGELVAAAGVTTGPATPEHEPGVQPDWCGYMAGKAVEALRQLGHAGLADHVEHLERAHAARNPDHLYGPPAGTEGEH